MVDFFDDQRQYSGVESLCKVLSIARSARTIRLWVTQGTSGLRYTFLVLAQTSFPTNTATRNRRG